MTDYEKPRILPKPETLKPCPFCGRYAVVITRDYIEDSGSTVWEAFHVTHWCDVFPSQLRTRDYPTKREAIAAWNRRAE